MKFQLKKKKFQYKKKDIYIIRILSYAENYENEIWERWYWWVDL